MHWETTGNGSTQPFPEYPDNGSSHSGEVEDYVFTSGQTTPRGSRIEHAQSMSSVWTNPRTTATSSSMAQAMSRVDSSRSSSSSLSQSSRMSRGKISPSRNVSRAAAVTAPMSGQNPCLMVPADANPVSSQMYWPDLPPDMNIGSGNVYNVTTCSPLHMAPAHMHLGLEAVLPENSSPGSWEYFSSSMSRNSSPATIDEAWLSSTRSSNASDILIKSPRYVNARLRGTTVDRPTDTVDRRSTDRKISVASSTGRDKVRPDDGLSLGAGLPGRRHGSDGEASARDHELYKNAAPGPDGLFHCPWEGQASCNHKAEKLKCNYE